jgi:hypothetical protein
MPKKLQSSVVTILTYDEKGKGLLADISRMTSFLTIPPGRNATYSGKRCQAGFAYRCFLGSFHEF